MHVNEILWNPYFFLKKVIYKDFVSSTFAIYPIEILKSGSRVESRNYI